jgi:hypothetical protein
MINFSISKQLDEVVISPYELTVVVFEIAYVFFLTGTEGTLSGAVLFTAALEGVNSACKD